MKVLERIQLWANVKYGAIGNSSGYTRWEHPIFPPTKKVQSSPLFSLLGACLSSLIGFVKLLFLETIFHHFWAWANTPLLRATGTWLA
jgi:hypothetical protein